ncbi:hypothetical protein [Lactobacillus terrae]|uniref:hypothetical protein n=1 Tax=Lactobacillus terrae TaxID=2269374 RepID=UPI000C1B6D68|nr:hypothetical protein [Lactobacillus terrae]
MKKTLKSILNSMAITISVFASLGALTPAISNAEVTTPSDEVQSTGTKYGDWSDSVIHTVVQTKDLLGIPLYDKDGNVIENRSLGANSFWFTDTRHENSKTGEVFYRVATNEYVSEKSLTSYVEK